MRKFWLILLLLPTGFGTVTGLSSGYRVLCIGSDHHFAIEMSHHTCPELPGPQPSHGDFGDQGAARKAIHVGNRCTDYEFPPGVVNVAPPVKAGHSQSTLAPFFSSAIPAYLLLNAAGQGWAERLLHELPTGGLARARSVVLLI